MNPQDLSRQHAQLRRLARAIVGESYADDVVQDVWAAALVHSGPAPSNPDAWLNRVVRNIAWKSRLKERRARARELDRASLDLDGSSDMESPEALIAEVEEKHALERSVLELEEPYRSALLWRYYGGLAVSDVAARMGHNASTTRTHIKRGLEQLRGRLAADGGTEWRAALVPLLGRGLDLGGAAGAASAAKSASVHGASKAGATSAASVPVVAAKALAVAAAAALLFVGGRTLLGPADAISTPSVNTVAMEAGPMAEPEAPLVKVSASVERTVTAAPAPSREVELAGAALPAAVVPDKKTTVSIVEASSGKPLAGVVVDVRYAYMKKRGFFTSSTDFATVTVTTDALGRAVIPVGTNDQGQSASNSLSASLRTGDQSGAEAYLSPVEGKKDGVVELRLSDARAFHVRLPETVTKEESEALAATLVTKRGTSVFTDSRIFRPVRVDGRDLTFVMGRLAVDPSSQAATLHIATTDRGRSFHAEVPSEVNLATDPLEAVRANDVIHTYRLVHGVTGAPLETEVVSVGRPPEGQPYASREALGLTDKDGKARLIGIPAGEVTMFVQAKGFEEFRAKGTPVAGGTTEVRLVPIAGLRSVALTVEGPGRELPSRLSVDVRKNDRLSSQVASLTLVPTKKDGGGWNATGVLENIPGEVCFLGADALPGNYDTLGPVRIEPGQDEVKVVFGAFHKLTSVRLRLPPLVEVEYQQRAGDGRLYSRHGSYSDGGVVGTVQDDGRPVMWIVTAPGHVPVVGTDKAWSRVEDDGEELIEITPDLRPGWGLLVNAEHREWDKTEPFHFRKEQPIAGVTIFDGVTGKTLGVTDETGYVVITAEEPLLKVGARYGDETKNVDLKGAPRVQFGF